jgi:hypothetical protein
MRCVADLQWRFMEVREPPIDIDLLILSDSLPRVFEVARALGYTVRGLDMNFDPIHIRRVSKIDPETHYVFTLDLILVSDAIRKVWESRLKANLEGGKLSVVSKEGLIALKTISGRPQDIADIAALNEESNANG